MLNLSVQRFAAWRVWALILTAVLAAGVPVEARASGAVEELRLVVNLPAYRLDVIENGRTTRSYPVAIGKASHRTPRGNYRIPHIEWNPWWTPPASPWARGKSRTPPGPNNPMGRAKIYFQNLYYIHGSPEVGSLGSAASHGCVRMSNEDVLELARLLHRYGSPEVSGMVLDGLETNPRRTRTVRVSSPVRLDIVYEVAEVRDGRLVLHPDVYGLAGPAVARESAVQALIAAGHAAVDIDRGRLDEVVQESRRSPISVPVDAVRTESVIN